MNFETFTRLDNTSKAYHLPSKQEWGMSPSDNDDWTGFSGIEEKLHTILKKQQSPLCWQKQDGIYTASFIVWW